MYMCIYVYMYMVGVLPRNIHRKYEANGKGGDVTATSWRPHVQWFKRSKNGYYIMTYS